MLVQSLAASIGGAPWFSRYSNLCFGDNVSGREADPQGVVLTGGGDTRYSR